MKKIISILLMCSMILGIMPILSLAAEPTKLTVLPYEQANLGGWEFWSEDGNEANKRVQLLIEAQDGNGLNYSDCEWEITFKSKYETKTVTLKSTSQYDYNDGQKIIYRFEPCDAAEPNKFVPTRLVDYTISAKIKDAGDVVAVVEETSGFKPGDAAGPVKEPKSDWEAKLVDGVLTITGIGVVENNKQWSADAAKIKKVVIGDGITGLSDKLFYFTSGIEEVVLGKDCKTYGVEVFSFCNNITKFTFNGPVEKMDKAFNFGNENLKEVVLNNGQTFEEFKAVAGVEGNDNFNPNYGFGKAKFTVLTKIEPYGIGDLNGWENWNDDGQTNLLVNVFSSLNYSEAEWTFTISSVEGTKTVVLKSTSNFDYGDGKFLYRFHPCLATGENQFIPTPGVDYTLQVVVKDGGEVVATSGECSGFIFGKDLKPVVPADPTPDPEPKPDDGKLIIEMFGDPKIKGESWKNEQQEGDSKPETQLLVVVYNSSYNKAGIEFRITFNDGTTTKTVTLEATSYWELVAPGAEADYPNGVALYRFQPCNGVGENQFVPVAGADYKLTVAVLENGKVIAESDETTGFSVADNFEPVVPGEPTPDPEVYDKFGVEPLGDPGSAWENTQQEGDNKPETQFLIVAYSNEYTAGGYQWKITFSDGKTTKTVVLEPTSVFDVTDQVPAAQYPNGAAIYRFQPCNGVGENQFVPKAGTDYKISVQVLKDGAVVAECGETEGFGTAAGFEPVVPATPTPDPDPEPPVTGDVTAIVAVLAVVALFGTAVVVSKKVRA